MSIFNYVNGVWYDNESYEAINILQLIPENGPKAVEYTVLVTADDNELIRLLDHNNDYNTNLVILVLLVSAIIFVYG